MGLKGTGSDTYTVTDLFVPARYTFTRESAADRRETGPLYRFTTFQLYGAALPAWRSGSRGRRSMPSSQMASTKVPMLGAKPLRDNAVVQSQGRGGGGQWQSSRAF